MTSIRLSPALALALAGHALAQTPPTAGDVLRQATPPAAPAAPAPALPTIAPLPAPMKALPGDGGKAVPVRSVRVEGNRVIATDVLQAQVQDAAGKPMTLAQMEELATRLTRYYRAQGYFVARAYVPAQDLTDGQLVVRVVEGNYGRFVLDNRSLVRDDVVQGLLDDVKDSDIVSLDTLERAMLIINDTPGVQVVKADVLPGQKVGTSDFAIGTTATAPYDGFVLADNHGSRYTGRERVTFGANWNSPTGRGDRLGATGLASTNGNLLNARVAYSALARSDGTRIEGAVGRTTYSLGDVYSALGARGTADSYELSATHPWKRTRNASVELGAGLVHRDLRDEVGATATSTRKTSDALVLRASTNRTHGVFGMDGITAASATVTFGTLHFRDAAAGALDAAGAQTAGSWSKLNLAATRVSALPSRLQLTTGVRAQHVLNGRNLDGSERLTVSGVGGVPAYPLGELAGDNALVAQAELAAPLGTVGDARVQGTVFADWGLARAAHPINAAGQTRQIADAGVGLNVGYGNSLLRVALATRVHGGAPTSEPAPRTRLLVQAGLTF
ncbi:ShlB/FhaC/HecB family hemolysin secretion/activation protein [Ramlibacter humi]|uniref:ShlB/FhaC/HecB family hemolysin secretion/activation protein n=1 Tax=Ramlibacter humi TaxID=2530451 RepID=A0A4Z0BNX7_9BURK|nr:POTRA domain-containing protein [Ramlibacter humi]TFZ00134.1 ShlB/FhaC/HecB family hemolysin secretion/activation protein [Ramlibacter humi]